MVTQATSEAGNEAPPTTEAQSPEEVDMDSPLITEATESEEVSTETQGAEPSEEGGADDQLEGAAEETEEPEETEETPEQAAARTYSEEEVSKIQSELDRRIAAAEKKATEAEQQIEQMRSQQTQREQQQQLQAQVLAYRDEVRQGLISQGHDEQGALDIANKHTLAVKAAWEAEQKATRLQQELQASRESSERTAASTLARDMAEKYGVSRDDIPLLAQTPSLQQMEALAKRIGGLTKRASERSQSLQDEVKPDGPEQKFDTGGGRAGLSDDQKLADINTPLDEVERILENRGLHPFR